MFQGLYLEELVLWMNGLPPEWMWIATGLVCFLGIIGMLKLFGEAGLYAYMMVGIIVSNILVLKAVKFSIYDKPIALGTIIFTSTFLCTDILTEYYGSKSAKKGVYLGFMGMLIFTMLMGIGLGFRPVEVGSFEGVYDWANENHAHMKSLFLPTPALFVSGLIAFLSSQLIDVRIFSGMKKLTKGRYLWLRNNVSMMVSALLDNAIFSVFAWVIFAKTPMSWEILVFTYILGTYWIRVAVALLGTPLMYLAGRIARKG